MLVDFLITDVASQYCEVAVHPAVGFCWRAMKQDSPRLACIGGPRYRDWYHAPSPVPSAT